MDLSWWASWVVHGIDLLQGYWTDVLLLCQQLNANQIIYPLNNIDEVETC